MDTLSSLTDDELSDLLTGVLNEYRDNGRVIGMAGGMTTFEVIDEYKRRCRQKLKL